MICCSRSRRRTAWDPGLFNSPLHDSLGAVRLHLMVPLRLMLRLHFLPEKCADSFRQQRVHTAIDTKSAFLSNRCCRREDRPSRGACLRPSFVSLPSCVRVWRTTEFLCALSANKQQIEFLEFTISDYVTKNIIFMVSGASKNRTYARQPSDNNWQLHCEDASWSVTATTTDFRL